MTDQIGGVVGQFGGSGAKTDRSQQLQSYGDLNDVFSTLQGYGKKLMGRGDTQAQAGAQDTGQASKYYSSILSGNPAAVNAAAAPEINAITGQANQQKKELANFGNRSGGKVAAGQNISAGTRGAIADTIAGQRSGAAGAKAGIGAGETSAGTASTGQAIGATEGAGSVAGTLGDLAGKSRMDSKKIHDQSVQQWTDLVTSVLMAGSGA